MQLRTKTFAALLLFALPACSASHSLSPQVDQPPSTEAFEVSMHKMHQDMMINYTGNTDKDFAASMIPHHEGAIDMANTELKYGTDPKMRKLARQIIVSQKKEVAYMQKWLNTHQQ